MTMQVSAKHNYSRAGGSIEEESCSFGIVISGIDALKQRQTRAFLYLLPFRAPQMTAA
jgi:hypothetical protein